MSKLEQLKKMTVVVADTGDIEAINDVKPVDATTNPSLLYKASQQVQYSYLIKDAVEYVENKGYSGDEKINMILDKMAVNFGCEILKIVPGRVSTEIDSQLSFDTEATIARAKHIIGLYDEAGISKERILIKIASTWEGIQAASVLEKEGIHCNLTLLFSMAQAVACAEAGVTLISPFVGRILDWFKKSEGVDGYAPAEDPGVISVTEIYHYYKKFGYKTVIMGASFRNVEEILELAGCDLLTISPDFIHDLSKSEGHVERKLDPEHGAGKDIKKIALDEKTFRWMLNEDAMGTEKLSEGIRNFTKDTLKLVKHISDLTK